jgi:CRP/FNR family transcriptional regulator, cyclic AMP receptor protein
VVDARLHRGLVSLLEEDPDLGAGIAESELDVARRQSIVGVIELRPPGWDPAGLGGASAGGWLGLMVLDGLLLRRVQTGKRAACELCGSGDLLRPWDTDGDYDPLVITVDWLVLTPVRLAVLDATFSQRIARWPVITNRVVSRVARRARYLALIQAVTQLPRTHARLLVLFWLLAERWGTVNPRGISVTLPITHDLLAMLVGVRRPTVTLALQRLSRAKLIVRERSDRWLLTKQAMELLDDPDRLELVEITGSDEEPSPAASGPQ